MEETEAKFTKCDLSELLWQAPYPPNGDYIQALTLSHPALLIHCSVAVPADVHDTLNLFHKHPSVWWVGQLLAFLMRPNEGMKQLIDDHKKALDWGHPIVG